MTPKAFADLLFKRKYFAINLNELSLCLGCGRLDYDTVYIGRRLKINLHLNLYWRENPKSRGTLLHFASRGVVQCSVNKTAKRYDADYKMWQSEACISLWCCTLTDASATDFQETILRMSSNVVRLCR